MKQIAASLAPWLTAVVAALSGTKDRKIGTASAIEEDLRQIGRFHASANASPLDLGTVCGGTGTSRCQNHFKATGDTLEEPITFTNLSAIDFGGDSCDGPV